MTDALHGVGVTPVTPFTDDLVGVNLAGFRANLEFLLDAGVELIYPAGNTGEMMSLSPDEWTEVVETAVEVCGDRAAVIPGVGHEYPVALELARRASTLGVRALLLMPRTQPYACSSGLAEYWRAIGEAARLPLVVYKRNLPEDSVLARVVGDSRVVACKYAGKDVAEFASVVDAAPGHVTWICGLAERYAPAYWQAGAKGFTSGLANFAPQLALGMYRALERGDRSRVGELRTTCGLFEGIRGRQGDAFNVAAVKAAMDMVGLAGGKVRPPLRDLDPEGLAAVGRFVEAIS